MFVVEVIPLIRGTQIESLSYFSATSYPAGTFISIPIRGKQATGMVLSVKPVSSTKTALKAATFSLRKLPQQEPLGTLPSSLLSLAKEAQTKLPVQVGALLYTLLPPDIRDSRAAYPHTKSHQGSEDATPQIVQSPREERFVFYRSHIRSCFAHRGSVLFVVPSSAEIETVRAELQAGIEDRVICFSPHQGKKARLKAYEDLEDLRHAKLIITTTSHAYLERDDLTSIIIEHASSPYYVGRTKPYLDHRQLLQMYAHTTHRQCVLGDIVVRTEDEYKRRNDVFATLEDDPKRFALAGKLSVIKQNDKPNKDTPFTLFSHETLKAVGATLENRRNVFMLAARRGLAPVVACYDCGYIFRCPDSGTPYSLMRTYENDEEVRWFLSGTSGKRVRAADVCASCGSWRLRERGIGIQHVYDELKKHVTNQPIIIFDHTTAKTYKRAVSLRDSFYKEKGAVLLGTAMALPYLHKPVSLSVITSLDATRSMPTWKADEYLFHTLLSLRDQSEKEVIVQTRSDPDDLLVYAGRAAVERFFDDEIKLREMLKYPPFSVFILLTWSGSTTAVKKVEVDLRGQLEGYETRFYSNPQSTTTKVLRHCLLRIKPEHWPNEPLLETLRHFPPFIKIEINPDRIV